MRKELLCREVFPSRFAAVNTGKRDTRGIELAFHTRPAEVLRLTANAAILDTWYKVFQNIACWVGQPILPFG